MEKMMLFMLTLLVLGAANVNAQVRIGGTTEPAKSAVLDLNADNSDTPAGNAGGLALPRVALSSLNQQLSTEEANKPGTVVYSTAAGDVSEGTYVWTKVDGGGSTAIMSGSQRLHFKLGTVDPTLSTSPSWGSYGVYQLTNLPIGCDSNNTWLDFDGTVVNWEWHAFFDKTLPHPNVVVTYSGRLWNNLVDSEERMYYPTDPTINWHCIR